MKKWIIPVIVIIVILFLALCKGHRREVIISGTPVLHEFLFPTHEQAVPVEDPILPDSLWHIEPLVAETVTGSGYWIPDETYTPEDTLEVEISEIESTTGEKWLRIEIENKPVTWRKLDHFEREPKKDRSTFHFIPLEYSNCAGAPLGIGIAWTPVEVWDFDIGIAATIELDPSPEWAALQGRISHHIGDSHVSIAFSGGGRLGRNNGSAFGFDISFDI